MLKILQARLQQHVNWELPDVQAEFRKGRGTRDQIANICWIIEKAREFQKNIWNIIDYAKAFDCVDHNKLQKFFKRWEYQTPWPASWEICMQVKKQQVELDMEQQTGSKLGKEYVKAVYCHSAYLTYMQSTSWETLGWKKHKLGSTLNIHWKNLCWSWSSNTLGTWCEELTHWKRPWYWERLRAREE